MKNRKKRLPILSNGLLVVITGLVLTRDLASSQPATDPAGVRPGPSEVPAESLRDFALAECWETGSDTIAHAKTHQAALANNAGLNRYVWNFPQPTILGGQQVSFRVEGTHREESP